MRRHIFSFLLLLMAFAAGAASHLPAMPDEKADRSKWMQEMQQHQNDFLAKELELSDKQRADFLPLYNKMRAELLNAANASRDKAKEVRKKGDTASDADFEAATKAYLDFRTKEAEIVKAYYKKFSHILTKRQLYKLDSTERKFDRMLMEHHQKGSSKNKEVRNKTTRSTKKTSDSKRK